MKEPTALGNGTGISAFEGDAIPSPHSVSGGRQRRSSDTYKLDPQDTPISTGLPIVNEKEVENRTEPLWRYSQIKLALAAQLRILRTIIDRRGNEARSQRCEELIVKLAEDRFTLAVLGQFKRGKSSLMNALIGRALLPVGVLPLTSAITVLRFGPKERLLVTRSDMHLSWPLEEPLDRLEEYVTETHNPVNRKQVKTACLELPVPFLRRGVELVDTPGVGSTIAANTATTLKFLPDCDAVIFVTSVDSPFTQAELQFLQNIRRHVRKIFFVVNKIDLLNPAQREEVLQFVRDTLWREMGTDDVKVYPVSSKLGLKSKLGERIHHSASGLEALETSLAEFLSGEKASVFLAAVAERMLGLCRQESIEVAVQRRALTLTPRVRSERIAALTERCAESGLERKNQLTDLRERIENHGPELLFPELDFLLKKHAEVFLKTVENLLDRNAWVPLGALWSAIQSTALTELRSDLWNALPGLKERLAFESDPDVRQSWESIQSNLNALPTFALDLFGIASPDGIASFIIPWRLQVDFQPPFLPDFEWAARIPRIWTALPVALVRKALKRRLQAELTSLISEMRKSVIQYVKSAFEKALDEVVKKVEEQANTIGSRMVAILNNGIRAAPELDDVRPRNPDLAKEDEELRRVHAQVLVLLGEACPGREAFGGGLEDDSSGLPPSGDSQDFLRDSAGADSEPPDFPREFKTRSCPVCNHLSRLTFDFFAHFQYELATSMETQENFAVMIGFCPLHTWRLEAMSSPVGLSIGLAKLADHVSRLLMNRARALSNGHRSVKWVRESAECHVCRLLREAEKAYLCRLAQFVEGHGRTAYARSQGLCLKHLGLWLPILSQQKTVRFALVEASRRFGQLSEDMQNFSMKTEALRRQLHNADESDAYLRTITHLVGTRDNCMPIGNEGMEL